jgi:hypothetical protein
MTKKTTVSRTKLSQRQLQQFIRTESLDSRKIFFTEHVKQQMRKRHITAGCVIATLQNGVIKRRPEPNATKGTLECRMEYYVAGHNIGVIVAISDVDPDLVLVTAMFI